MQNCIRNLIKLCVGINSFLFSCKALRGLCCSDYLSTSFGGIEYMMTLLEVNPSDVCIFLFCSA